MAPRNDEEKTARGARSGPVSWWWRILLGGWTSALVGFTTGAFLVGSLDSLYRRIPEFILGKLSQAPTIAHFEYWVPVFTVVAAIGGAFLGLVLGIVPALRTPAVVRSVPPATTTFLSVLLVLAARSREHGEYFTFGKTLGWIGAAAVAAVVVGVFFALAARALATRTGLRRAVVSVVTLVVLYPALSGIREAAGRKLRPVMDTVEIEGNHRVLLIGLDAVTWKVLDPLLEAGEMPVLRRLIENGVQADLVSQSPIESPPVWTTVATGKYPEEHGIDFFVTKLPGSAQAIPAASTMRKSSALWNIFTDHGRSSGVIGYYVSWPAEPVLGYIVSDRAHLAGADSLPGVTYPPELFAEEIAAIDSRDERLIERDNVYGYASARLVSSRPTDFHAIYFRGTDNLQHLYWNQLYPDDFSNVEHLLPSPDRKDIVDTYLATDEMLGRILAQYGDDVTVFVVSDHGFESITWLRSFEYDLNPLYQALGWLDYESDGATIDWSATRVYEGGGRVGDRQRYASLNLVGREETGIVASEDLNRERAEVIERLRSLTNEHGRQVFQWVRPSAAEKFGDIHLKVDPRALVHGEFVRVGDRELPNSVFATFHEGSGRHNRVGILIASGANVRSGARAYHYGPLRRTGFLRKASVIDVCPTILYAMGFPVGSDMQGEVLTDLFEPAFLNANPVRFVQTYDREREGLGIDPSASGVDDQITQQLRALGYIQ